MTISKRISKLSATQAIPTVVTCLSHAKMGGVNDDDVCEANSRARRIYAKVFIAPPHKAIFRLRHLRQPILLSRNWEVTLAAHGVKEMERRFVNELFETNVQVPN
jgi:hypothetical protein